MVHSVVWRCWGVTVVVGVAPPVAWHLLLHPLGRVGHFTLLAFEPGGGGSGNMFSHGQIPNTKFLSKLGPGKRAKTVKHKISSMYQYVKTRWGIRHNN